jgi:HK97 gp10 family phage protein
MPETVICNITGLDELQAALEALPKKVSRKIERGAMRDAAKIVVQELASEAPKDTGLVEEHFGIRITTKHLSKIGPTAMRALIGGITGIYYPPAEFHRKLKKNADPRDLRVSVNKALHYLEFGSRKEPKRPFMSRAFEAVKQTVLAKFIADLKDALGL